MRAGSILSVFAACVLPYASASAAEESTVINQWNTQNYTNEDIIPDGDEMVNIDQDAVVGLETTGNVYGYVTVNSKSPFHLKVIMTRQDGTLGLENDGSKTLEAVLFDENGILFQPYPLRVVNVDNGGQFRLMETLYRPTTDWRITEKRVLQRKGKSNAWVCPHNGVNQIYWLEGSTKCVGGSPVLLMAADLKTRTVELNGVSTSF